MLCEFLVSKAMQSRTGYAHPGCEWSVFLVCHQMAVNTVFFWLSQTKLAICFHCPVYRWISPLTTVKPEQYTICIFWLSFGQILTIYCQWIKVSSARNYLVVEKLLNSIIFSKAQRISREYISCRANGVVTKDHPFIPSISQ